jgi:photosynthetic reaction center cytochrome c subunit
MSFSLKLTLAILGLLFVGVVLTTFERPPVATAQLGFRGLAMEQVNNPRTFDATLAANRVPEGIAPVPAVGPLAGQVYQNVQLLGDLSVGQFTRLMVAITTWVSPEQGCNYCHVAGNMAAEDVYTKQITRRMLQMVKHINEQWTSHVGEVGVTCYTCHRGQPIPAQVWSEDRGPVRAQGQSAVSAGQNLASRATAYASLPYDPFTPFLRDELPIRIASTQPLANENRSSIKQAEWTYGLMMHFSQALGVNCTFCHNSRSFFDWDQSSTQRTVAWHGIRMVRSINNTYIDPLQPVWAANRNGPPGGPVQARLGPHGDALKTNCATCHQGAWEPLLGAQMLRDFPELNAVRTQ